MGKVRGSKGKKGSEGEERGSGRGDRVGKGEGGLGYLFRGPSS